VIEVDDLVNGNSGNVWMQSASGRIDGGTGTAVSPHWWGTFYYRDNWQKVTILNHSGRDLVIDNIDPINRDVNLHPRVKENAPGGSLADAQFSIVRQVDPTLITITNDHTLVASNPDHPFLLINGTIENPLGQTDITNQYGPNHRLDAARRPDLLAVHVGAVEHTHTSLIRSNILHLYAGDEHRLVPVGRLQRDLPSEDNLCRDSSVPCVNVDLVWWRAMRLS
jgi:hypothetical protein